MSEELLSDTSDLIKETQRARPLPPCQAAGRTWSSRNQGAGSNHADSASALTLDLPAFRVLRNKFLLFISHMVWGSLLQLPKWTEKIALSS